MSNIYQVEHTKGLTPCAFRVGGGGAFRVWGGGVHSVMRIRSTNVNTLTLGTIYNAARILLISRCRCFDFINLIGICFTFVFPDLFIILNV